MAGTAKALALLCFLSALAIAHCEHFIVQGRVYCDTCRFGFETKASTYIPGAKVRVECKDRTTGQMTYSIEGITDETGTYKIPVEEDRPDEICEAILVSSPISDCKEFESGRERARILLTKDNGISNHVRFANSLGFIKDKPLPGCSELLKQYELDE
ncbi:pollen-specific protein C13-like [Nymphaea colorata]|nr:pollen-specific protein C13-like [Nymphaea colorata]